MCRVGVLLFLVSCVTLSVFLVHVDGKSAIAITSPSNLKRTITQYTPAVFGNPKYGGYVNGVLFYPSEPINRLGCFPINVAKEKDLPTGERVSVIWMLDRSPDKDDDSTDWNDVCSFVTKVRYAQQAGAVAVVVVNRQQPGSRPTDPLEDALLVYMADDGSGGDVSSPAVMIQHSAAQPLIDAMRTGTGTPKTFNKISMQISWSIPTDDGNVKWELWTSSYDTETQSFKRIFGPADAALHRNTTFTPRYFYYSGKDFDMQDCTVNGNPCGDLCVGNGRYCQYDPDGDEAATFTGADIVLENLWQSCVWDTLDKVSQADGGNAHMIRNKWWSYVTDFQDECNTHQSWQTTDCRYKIMERYKIEKVDVKACYDLCNLGSNGKCDMIDRDITDRTDNGGVFYLPTVVVNREAIRGSISCYSPISTTSCKVMSYICQGYSSSTRPAVCTNSADGCNFWEQRDCAGVCGGSSSLDLCGLCLGREDGSRDKTCRDCNLEINGNHTIDACGVCLEKTDISRNSTCKDCKGVVHGPAKIDVCGVCEGDGTSCEKSSTSVGAIIAIVLAISGVVGGAIYLYMRRQQNRMREDIDGILKQYLPLDGSAGGGSGHIRPTQRLDGHDNL